MLLQRNSASANRRAAAIFSLANCSWSLQ